MAESKFYFDQHGFPHAEYQPPNEILGWFLEQDVQNSPNSCKWLLQLCEEIDAGTRQEYDGTGNAHAISIVGNRVHIENLFTDSIAPSDLSIDEFRAGILSWMRLITSVSKEKE